MAETDLPPAHEQPLSLTAPPGPLHHFPEPKDTTGQARQKATAGSGHRMGPQVLCSVVCTASLPGTINVFTTVGYSSTASTNTTATQVHTYNLKKSFRHGLHYLCTGSTTRGGGRNQYVFCEICALHVGLSCMYL